MDEYDDLDPKRIECMPFTDLFEVIDEDKSLLWDNVRAEVVTGDDERRYRSYVGLPVPVPENAPQEER